MDGRLKKEPLPTPFSPMVDDDGRIKPEWYKFFKTDADALVAAEDDLTPTPVADSTIQSNISGAPAVPVANGISAVLDKLLGNTRGSLVYRGASAWQALAPGAAKKLLASQGSGADPDWVSPPRWEYINEYALAGLTNCDVTGLSAYRALRLTILSLLPTTDNVSLHMVISSDNGASFYSTNYTNHSYATEPGDKFSITPTSATSANRISNSATTGQLNAVLSLFDFNEARATRLCALQSGVYTLQTGLVTTLVSYCTHTPQTAMNAFRMFLSSGTFARGSVVVEGMT